MSPDERLLELMRMMKFDLIIPIPQNERRTIERGHASALEVARFFSRLLDLPVEKDWLKLKPESKRKQALLNGWERRFLDNPFEEGFISIEQNLRNGRILIVDDFVTTGSTLTKAANIINAQMNGLEIYAGCLGWKPKIVRLKKAHLLQNESDSEFLRFQNIPDQNSLEQYQNVSQFAQEHK
jgi:hypoxanthine phosphoribosyltransferase